MNRTTFPMVGVGVICSRNGKVLLLHRAHAHGAGSWSMPGGHLEFGETPEDCALREMLEETGVHGVHPRFVALTNDIFPKEGKHYITIWMQVDYAGGIAALTAPEESTEVGWFDWKTLPQPLFIPLQNLLGGKSNPSFADIVQYILADEKK